MHPHPMQLEKIREWLNPLYSKEYIAINACKKKNPPWKSLFLKAITSSAQVL